MQQRLRLRGLQEWPSHMAVPSAIGNKHHWAAEQRLLRIRVPHGDEQYRRLKIMEEVISTTESLLHG